MINFQKAYFIKLGRHGNWEKECIKDGIIRFGFNNPFHNECLSGDYEKLREFFILKQDKPKTETTKIINQIKIFYEADDSTIWITFYQKKLWWCFAAPGIQQLDDGTRIRKTKNGWKSTDESNQLLSVDKLSGKLTKVQMFQGTICKVKDYKDLYSKINAIILPEVKLAQDCLNSLVNSLKPLIQKLTWKDFELLIDLLFVNGGWKRLGVIGKTEKDIDLDLMMPLNGRRAFVQIKASSHQVEFDEYFAKYSENDLYDEMYFVVHTLKKSIQKPESSPNVTILDIDSIASLVVKSGMTEWLISKTT